MVVTSAWSRWQPEKAAGTDDDIEAGLRELIGAHRPRWDALARAAVNAAQPSDKPFDRLMRIIGRLASCRSNSSRKAVSDAYAEQRLRFPAAPHGCGDRQLVRSARRGTRRKLHRDRIPLRDRPKEPLLAAIAFLADTDAWQAPIVDRDPGTPLSERDPITAYDGTRNYLHWLAAAARADLKAECFIGLDGASVARPTVLLYALLRHALLAALEQDALGLARDKGSRYFDVLDAARRSRTLAMRSMCCAGTISKSARPGLGSGLPRSARRFRARGCAQLAARLPR